jgi:hypothetical protein
MTTPSSSPPPNPILTYYNEWVDRTPYVTRTSLIALCIVYLLSWFLDLDTQLGNVSYFTVMRYEVYRILTSPIVGNSIFSLILIFLFYPQVSLTITRLSSSLRLAETRNDPCVMDI